MSGSKSVGEGMIGLIAGQGGLPFAVAEGARSGGSRLAVFGLKGIACESLSSVCDHYEAIEVGKLGRLIKAIKKSGINRVVFAGKVPKTLLYRMDIVPDLRAVKLLMSLKDRKDDTIMEAILSELEKEGIRTVETTAFTGALMMPASCLTKRQPTDSELLDIKFGAELAREMGRLDVGQTVVVKERAVMSVEAIEGTDEAIRRGGNLAGKGGVVVKTAKPGQDLRFDVPVVGPDTLESLKEGGCSVLALEAGKVILFEREEMIRRADSAGISVVGFDD